MNTRAPQTDKKSTSTPDKTTGGNAPTQFDTHANPSHHINPQRVAPRDMLMLQRLIGNQATLALIAQRTPETHSTLRVRPARDPDEIEADQVADQVVQAKPLDAAQSPPIRVNASQEPLIIQRQIDRSVVEMLENNSDQTMTQAVEADHMGLRSVIWGLLYKYLHGMFVARGNTKTYEVEYNRVIAALGGAVNPILTEITNRWQTIHDNIDGKVGNPSATILLIEALRPLINQLIPAAEMVEKYPALQGCPAVVATDATTLLNFCPILSDLAAKNNLTLQAFTIFHKHADNNLLTHLQQFQLVPNRDGVDLNALAAYGALETISFFCPELPALIEKNKLPAEMFNEWVASSQAKDLKLQMQEILQSTIPINLKTLATYGPPKLILACLPEVPLLIKNCSLTAPVFGEWANNYQPEKLKGLLFALLEQSKKVKVNLKTLAAYGPLDVLVDCLPWLSDLAEERYLSAELFGKWVAGYNRATLQTHLKTVCTSPAFKSLDLRKLSIYGPLDMLAAVFSQKEVDSAYVLDNRLGQISGGKREERLQDYLSVLNAQKGIKAFPKDINYCIQLLKFGSVNDLLAIWDFLPEYDPKMLMANLTEHWDKLKLPKAPNGQRLQVFYRSYLAQDPDEPKEALGFELTLPDSPVGLAITELIADIRTTQKDRKNHMEGKLSRDLAHLPGEDNDSLRGQRIKRHAANLDSSGLSLARLKLDKRFQEIISKNNLEFDEKSGELRPQGKKTGAVATFFSGEQAYDPNPTIAANSAPGIVRDVYKKRGKPGNGKNNQYVKDDQDIFTRRYAYIEKNKYQFRDFVNTSSMQGRFPTDNSYDQAQPYNAIPNEIRRQVPDLPYGNEFANPYQLAYVHQELGSGPQQRGVSAASTSRGVYSNQGKAFKTTDGVRFEVDLARIPKGAQDKVPNLINHYTKGAKAKSLQGAGNLKIDKGDHKREFEHYQWSVRKNRELFLREVRPEYVSEVTMHQTAANTPVVAQPGVNPVFDQATLGTAAQHVGVEHYTQGFGDRINNQPDDSVNPHTTIPAPQRKYYQEGRADAVLYLTGYNVGLSRQHFDRNTNMGHLHHLGRATADADYRYRQGFWDAANNRNKRLT